MISLPFSIIVWWALLSFVAGFGSAVTLGVWWWWRRRISQLWPLSPPEPAELFPAATSASDRLSSSGTSPNLNAVPDEVIQRGADELMRMSRELNVPMEWEEARRRAEMMIRAETTDSHVGW